MDKNFMFQPTVEMPVLYFHKLQINLTIDRHT